MIGTYEEYRGVPKDDTPIAVEDIHMGVDIFREKGNLTVADFTELVYHRLDYDRFDYEDGERAMMEAIVLIQCGYLAAGGVLSKDISPPAVV